MYGKLFRQMFTSSIAEDRDTRHVFMDLIILSDRDGVVDMTVEAIARVTNAPVEDIKNAIERLSAPDSKSRNPKEEGRRIVPLDEGREWGWQIVNYEEYRDMRDTAGRTAYMRQYIRDYRASGKDKHRGKRGKQRVNTGKRGLAHVPVPVDAQQEFGLFWKVYPKKVGKKAAWKAWQNAKDKPDVETIIKAVKVAAATKDWQEKGGKFIPHPATWINQGRWDDEGVGPAARGWKHSRCDLCGSKFDQETGACTRPGCTWMAIPL